jgi:hypothetical protein
MEFNADIESALGQRYQDVAVRAGLQKPVQAHRSDRGPQSSHAAHDVQGKGTAQWIWQP